MGGKEPVRGEGGGEGGVEGACEGRGEGACERGGERGVGGGDRGVEGACEGGGEGACEVHDERREVLKMNIAQCKGLTAGHLAGISGSHAHIIGNGHQSNELAY